MSNSRKLTMEDLVEKPKEKEYVNNSFKDCNSIPKNQKDFGHKKRIKP